MAITQAQCTTWTKQTDRLYNFCLWHIIPLLIHLFQSIFNDTSNFRDLRQLRCIWNFLPDIQLLTWFGQSWALRHWKPRDFGLRSRFSGSRSLRLRRSSKCVAASLNSGSTLSAHEHWARLNTWQFFQETRPSAHCENSWQKADDSQGDALTENMLLMKAPNQP